MDSKLPCWMHCVLRIAGYYNLLAGVCMLLLYHEGYELLGIDKPSFVLPIQLVGLLVAIFGVGYLIVDRQPVGNANVLLLGLISKALGPMLAIGYIVSGTLPLAMLVVLFFADTIYVWPFWSIYRAIDQLGKPGKRLPVSES